MFNLRLNEVSFFLFLFFVIVTFSLDDGYLIYADLSKGCWSMDKKLLEIIGY